MAEDLQGVLYDRFDELVFKGDDAAIRDAGMQLLKEVGYDTSTRYFSKDAPMVDTGDAAVMSGMSGMSGIDDNGGMTLAEGADFHLF